MVRRTSLFLVATLLLTLSVQLGCKRREVKQQVEFAVEVKNIKWETVEKGKVRVSGTLVNKGNQTVDGAALLITLYGKNAELLRNEVCVPKESCGLEPGKAVNFEVECEKLPAGVKLLTIKVVKNYPRIQVPPPPPQFK